MPTLHRLLFLATVVGCTPGGHDSATDTGHTGTQIPMECEPEFEMVGELDPCDVAACNSCVEACGANCTAAMSYPVQYTCPGVGSWTVYNACPDWTMPEFTPCDDAAMTVTPSEVTPLGFSAEDVLAALAGPFQADAEWVAEEGRPPTTVSFTVVAAGDPVFHDREPAPTTGSIGADPQCPDQLEVPIQLGFSSADGAFDESLPTTVWAMELAALSTGATLDWQALTGSFSFVTVVPGDWDRVDLDLSTLLTPQLSGQVQMSATRDIGPNTGEGLVGPLLRWPPLN